MIEIEDLHKRFRADGLVRRLFGRPGPEVNVLRGATLTVHRGEFLALLGANGAGKTTLLKTIATLLLPDAGSVRVLGHDVVSDARRIRENVGYVLADERSFHWRLSARENLEFFATLGGLHGAESRRRIDHLLGRLDLRAAAGRDFASFSTGMKQRLAVARALLTRPPILLMDEPARSIDDAHAAEVWRLVREEVDAIDGCAVLVTHQIQDALNLCGRIALLDEGRVAVDLPAYRLNALADGVEGFTISVYGLPPGQLPVLQRHPGIRDVRIASQRAAEQTLEVWTFGGDAVLAGFIAELTGMGATVAALQRSTPLQGVLERLAVRGSHSDIRDEVAV